MTREFTDRGPAVGRTEHIIATAAGTAEALTVGVVRLAERTLVEALHAAEDVGAEIGSTLVQATRGSIRAATDIGGDLAGVGRAMTNGLRRATPTERRNARTGQERARQPLRKTATRRRRRRAAA